MAPEVGDATMSGGVGSEQILYISRKTSRGGEKKHNVGVTGVGKCVAAHTHLKHENRQTRHIDMLIFCHTHSHLNFNSLFNMSLTSMRHQQMKT